MGISCRFRSAERSQWPDKINLLPVRVRLTLRGYGRQVSTTDTANLVSDPEPTELISPREIARRWRCSRSSVDRIARRAGFTRFVLGEGRNGMVRYVRSEVERFETSRS